ncbi:hypothetical protein RhiirC2_428026 [Rhizophagus irregularis]|uniref:Protein kinase domain-containing protein n=1 Tax=Rhizophagus irregularis TaxID=588596 RepID=A0A2N1NBW2_9GLOM|nr:hypothetical protein RhiirC2_428026 [Rhizophagus irregularis]
MIMWELTTGRKPFFNIEHDINLIYQIIDEKRPKRPEITTDAPKCFTNLMKQCWYSDPSKRPSITTIKSTVDDWYRKCKKDDDILAKADNKRLELIESKQIGPEFTEKQDLSAIYTSQPLSSLISQVSSNNSSSRVSKQVCTSEECKFDTDNSHNTQRSSSINSSSGYISKDLDMDITNTQRLTTFESSSIKSSSGIIYFKRFRYGYRNKYTKVIHNKYKFYVS